MGTHVKVTPVTSFETHPDHYRHYTLTVDGSVATLSLDIQEENGLRQGDYLLKLNSYDLGVDLELHDAVERLRFEYPQVRTVIVTSGQPRVFCAGANIRMLASSTTASRSTSASTPTRRDAAWEEASSSRVCASSRPSTARRPVEATNWPLPATAST